MNHKQFDEMVSALYTSYVNLARKHGIDPIGFKTFKIRFKIWEW